MHNKKRSVARSVALLTLLGLLLLAQPAQAQTFTVLHTFTGGQDGQDPIAGLTIDKAGNFYGTAEVGGGGGSGTVFKLTRKGSGWVFGLLYTFAGNDGENPTARVIMGSNGSLYGTTFAGGNGGHGTVFKLTPPPTACKAALCPWTEAVLYSFTGGSDGASPFAEVLFNQAGNLYGTTKDGGSNNTGTVYELVPSSGGWTESVLHSFTGGNDGYFPYSGVIFDKAGNLYGTTREGGLYGSGVVYELSPLGSGWTENVIYTFTGGGDGANPAGGLIFDQAGNLYGTTSQGGSGGGGTAFELSPSNGAWSFNTLFSFPGETGPFGNLIMDAAGSLYGTTVRGGAIRQGSVFKLTSSSGSWTYTSLHDFTGGSDGAQPYCSVIFDPDGNLYGTTWYGGTYYAGVVWEITP